MRPFALFLALIVTATACGGNGDDLDPASSPTSGDEAAEPTEPSGDGDEAGSDDDALDEDPAVPDSAALLAAAVLELVTVDHTFGEGPPPFTEYLVQDRLDPGAGTGTQIDGEPRPLTTEERAAIEAALAPLGPVRFIGDPDDWRDDGGPTVDGAVIVGVGEPEIDGDTASIGVSLWCGSLCGTWLTYALDRTGEGWAVSGYDGPVAIS